jgi:hypothetical protein
MPLEFRRASFAAVLTSVLALSALRALAAATRPRSPPTRPASGSTV